MELNELKKLSAHDLFILVMHSDDEETGRLARIALSEAEDVKLVHLACLCFELTPEDLREVIRLTKQFNHAD